MRDYGKVHSTFWSSSTIRSLSEDARTLALYLLTCPHSTIAGVFRLPDGYVCEDLNDRLGWVPVRVEKGFQELLSKGFANRCETTKWTWVTGHFEWNPLENPNQRKAAKKIALSIPDDCAWKADFIRKCGALFDMSEEEIANASRTLPKPFPNQDQDQDQKQEQEQEHKYRDVEPERSTPVADEPGELHLDLAAPPSSPKPTAADLRAVAAERVFDHWRTTHGHARAVLDDKRRKVIVRALADGYSETDLCQAISGYRNSPHHMGRNPKRTVYDDIELFLRDAAHIDAGLKFHEEPPLTNFSEQTQRIIDQTEDWEPPEIRARRAAGVAHA